MKKRRLDDRVSDLICSKEYSGSKSLGRQPSRKLGGSGFESGTSISYSKGRVRFEQQNKGSRLLTQVPGESIRLDLRDFGIRHSPVAFGFAVPDDCLISLHIRRGDIAIVEPTNRILRVGDFLLVTIDGRDVLSRLIRAKRMWWLQRPGGKATELLPLWQHPYQGVVMGTLRLFQPAKPTRTRGIPSTAANSRRTA